MKNLGELASSMLGADFLERLQKNSDIIVNKPAAGYKIDAGEIFQALNVVPRTVLAWLHQTIGPMKTGDNKSTGMVPIVPQQATLHIQKIDRDLYNGHIEAEGREITRFKNKTLPGIGFVIMSTFEMYSEGDLQKLPEQAPKEASAVQYMISEHLLSRQGSERQAALSEAMLQEIMKLRLQTEISLQALRAEIRAIADKPQDSDLKLRRFLDNRIEKKEQNTFNVILAKGEVAECPDCGQKVYESSKFTPCICFGDDRDRKIFIKKSEEGTQIKFAKGWDPENMEMLLEILKRRGK
jgi:hypothetical protein